MNTKRFGYARVSTHEQHTDAQTAALLAAGCDRVFTEKASGAIRERPELARLLEQLREGDSLVVWRLDRLARSLPHLLELSGDLERHGVNLVSLNEQIDTTTPTGRLVFHVFAALAEFERGIIRERTLAGLAAARARGKHGGRPKKMIDTKIATAKAMYAEQKYTYQEIADTLGVSRTTIVRTLKSEPESMSQN